MRRQDLEDYLNKYLSITLFKDFCPNGLQIEGKPEIKKVATAVSVDLMTLQKAIEAEVDALIVHHGIFWERDPYPICLNKKKKIELLLKYDISLFAYHLPLDAHREIGNNWLAARELGWEELTPFGTFNGIDIGVKGTFAPQPVETFISELEAFYAHKAVVALGGKRTISSGALISGGAYKELFSAAQRGVDCFITGNYDEPAWSIAHEENIHFFALGHSATEKIGVKALAEHLKNQHSLAAIFLETNNPF